MPAAADRSSGSGGGDPVEQLVVSEHIGDDTRGTDGSDDHPQGTHPEDDVVDIAFPAGTWCGSSASTFPQSSPCHIAAVGENVSPRARYLARGDGSWEFRGPIAPGDSAAVKGVAGAGQTQPTYWPHCAGLRPPQW